MLEMVHVVKGRRHSVHRLFVMLLWTSRFGIIYYNNSSNAELHACTGTWVNCYACMHKGPGGVEYIVIMIDLLLSLNLYS